MICVGPGTSEQVCGGGVGVCWGVTTETAGVGTGVAVEGDEDWTHPPIRTQNMRIKEMRTRKHFFISGNLSRHRLILLSFPTLVSHSNKRG